jgi:hypothetical protein
VCALGQKCPLGEPLIPGGLAEWGLIGSDSLPCGPNLFAPAGKDMKQVLGLLAQVAELVGGICVCAGARVRPGRQSSRVQPGTGPFLLAKAGGT